MVIPFELFGVVPQAAVGRKGAAARRQAGPPTRGAGRPVFAKLNLRKRSGNWFPVFAQIWFFDAPERKLICVPTGKDQEHGNMIQHSRASMVKATMFIAGGLAFFLVVMHQASQLFR
jgi:hypothetical protein